MGKLISVLLISAILFSGAFALGEEVRPINSELPSDIDLFSEESDLEDQEAIKTELGITEVNGLNMVHIRPILEKFNFEVNYNNEDKSVEIVRGPYHSIIKVNNNSYYKLRMAPRELSSAPIIQNNKMYVPLEFLTLMVDIALDFEEDKLIAHNQDFTIYAGYISEISETENGKIIVLTDESLEYDMDTAKVIHLSKNTVLNGKLSVGEFIEIISPPNVMLSLPPQMGAIVIFQTE